MDASGASGGQGAALHLPETFLKKGFWTSKNFMGIFLFRLVTFLLAPGNTRILVGSLPHMAIMLIAFGAR